MIRRVNEKRIGVDAVGCEIIVRSDADEVRSTNIRIIQDNGAIGDDDGRLIIPKNIVVARDNVAAFGAVLWVSLNAVGAINDRVRRDGGGASVFDGHSGVGIPNDVIGKNDVFGCWSSGGSDRKSFVTDVVKEI